ncbi:Structural maintenance of chromosomes protein 3 [Elasticomyces elasticus]|nr:Structural maintenance of chromosomes protein 3 [Elasticomyces elasticus]
MDDTEYRRTKIDESLDHIRGTLGELEEEKEELRAFQDKDHARRCLEYTIHHEDQEALQEALEKLEGTVKLVLSRLTTIAKHSGAIKLLSAERAQLEDERRDIAKQKAKIELDVQTTIDNQISAQEAHTKHADDLRTVQEQISEREAELSQLLPEYTAKKKQERALRQQIADANRWLELVLELTVTIRSKTRNERLKLCPRSCSYSNLPQGYAVGPDLFDLGICLLRTIT